MLEEEDEEKKPKYGDQIGITVAEANQAGDKHLHDDWTNTELKIIGYNERQ